MISEPFVHLCFLNLIMAEMLYYLIRPKELLKKLYYSYFEEFVGADSPIQVELEDNNRKNKNKIPTKEHKEMLVS